MKSISLATFLKILAVLIILPLCMNAQVTKEQVNGVKFNFHSNENLNKFGRVLIVHDKIDPNILLLISGNIGNSDTVEVNPCDLASIELEPCDSTASSIEKQNRSFELMELSTYPNPSNSIVSIIINSTVACMADVDIIDLYGQTIKSYGKFNILPGFNRIVWDISENNEFQINSGQYFIKIQSNENTITTKQIIIK